MISEQTKNKILSFQKNEITEHIIYDRLSRAVKDKNNSHVLKNISADELRHYKMWKNYSQADARPDRFKILKYIFISKILGITFGIKLMEKGELGAYTAYEGVSKDIPEAMDIAREEDKHENELINMIDEERLKYVGSIVLGLNDALVELTGALAGLTFALADSRLVATAGFITGIAASLSMAASEYLSTKSEGSDKNPVKSCIYTGVAYIFTVSMLIYPYLVFNNLYLSLAIMLVNAVAVILCFTFYISVAKDMPFKKRFFEMAGISLGVALLSFIIGIFVRQFLGIKE